MWAVFHFQRSIPSFPLRAAVGHAFKTPVDRVQVVATDPPFSPDSIYLDITDQRRGEFPLDVLIALPDQVIPTTDLDANARMAEIAQILSTPILVDLSTADTYRYADPSGIVLNVTINDRRFDDDDEFELSKESLAELKRAISSAA